MTPQDRALKKQLLVMKGEALRVKLRLEQQKLAGPLQWACDGLSFWRAPGGLSSAFALLGKLMPSDKLGRWLKSGAALLAAWRLLRRALRH
ncbi:hypothetical protein [Chromobacterium amazonense]|uniref:hypothetical protein n=1 Tax=Chromobacterium amazonense TaxID=1382803 RepID=UPI0021B7BE96|nr:hypothetical protein [Chromobacterium amazonense]MBM2884686.1 hypothetical protein [Chromobacterium amazonense]MDE1716077.1 hypothetical protein [Chromobacterium amazonense]